MNIPPIVSPEEWDAARQELLTKEKKLTRARDALAAERRRMPRMAVGKEYRFEGPRPGELLDLFDGRRQLIVYRFFFEPGVADWPEGGCRGCSFLADQVAHLAHLNARDTTLAFVSRAPQPDIERWKSRMGWQIPWYSSRTTSTPTSASASGTAPTPSCAKATRSSGRTSSTPAATRRWETPGATSTSPRSDVRRNGRIRPRAIRNSALQVVEPARRVRRWRVSRRRSSSPGRAGRKTEPVGAVLSLPGHSTLQGCVTR